MVCKPQVALEEHIYSQPQPHDIDFTQLLLSKFRDPNHVCKVNYLSHEIDRYGTLMGHFVDEFYELIKIYRTCCPIVVRHYMYFLRRLN